VGLPPLPQGYQLQGPPERDPNLLQPLFSLGVEATNGYRTPADIQRLKAQGYQPAANSLHLNGDAVDLTPGRSGLGLSDLAARANSIAARYPGAKVLNEGDHIHVEFPGWGMAPGTPGTPNSGLPPLPAGATLQQRGSLRGSNFSAPAALNASTALTPLTLTGSNHDGDTLALANGRNGRLMGADAFELNQSGRLPNGQLVPLGVEGRDFMRSQIGPGMFAFPTGAFTFGRPVVTLSQDPSNDPGQQLLRAGLGMAEPQYLNGSPQFGPYMEAERLARLNRLGGFATNAETPSQFRHGNGPWASAQPGVYGQGADVTFFDQPTPFQGLRPEIAKGYLAVADNPNSTADDIMNYAAANGFNIKRSDAEKFVTARNKGAIPTGKVTYEQMPRPMIDPGDKAFGSFMRGVGDPINVLDEAGAVVDSFGGTPGRMNVFNAPSGTRWGDIYNLNLDQNRAILEHDQATHPYARFGGQLASGLAIPAGSIEGVGARATEAALEKGVSQFAAAQAAKRAVTTRLGTVGAIQGGITGFGGGEDTQSRLTGAALGTAGGAALGVVAPPVFDAAISGGRRVYDLLAPGQRQIRQRLQDIAERPLAESSGFLNGSRPAYTPDTQGRVVSPLGNGGAANPDSPPVPPPPEGFTITRANMASENGPELVGPVERPRDVINVNGVPPLPEGFTLQAPFGVTRPINERLSADEMANLAAGVDPRSVLPRPGNQIRSLDEAIKANPGRFEALQPPNPADALPTITVRSGNDLFRSQTRRDIFDVTKMLRRLGGVKDEGGDLAHMGITNAPRPELPFGRNEQFLGKLINNESGMSLDQAGEKLWEMGYFPERPTTSELLDVLHQEHLGNSHYHPEDMADVGAFHQLQDQRNTMDAAAYEGRPFVDERGSEISLDDLIKNTPPADAYEEMPRVTGRIGNLNLDKLENPQQINALVDQISNRVGGFSAASRGRITNEETQRLAQEMGVKPEQLLQRQQGQALNAEQLYATRALVQGSRERVVRLAKAAVGGSDEDLAAFRKAWLLHAAIEEQLSGATSEAGRALQQFKMLASGKDASGEAIRSYLRGGGGRDTIEDAAQKIVDLSEDPAKANRFIADSVKPTWRDKFNELWVNSLLSGPRTHVVNFVGNALTTAAMLPEQALTAGIGTLTRSADRTTIGEVGARLRGMVNGSLEGLKALKSSAGEMVTNPGAWLANEHGPADMASKVDNAQFHAINGVKGQIVRLPTRALTAADEFWKAINSNAELHALAYREATKMGGSPEAWDANYERLLHAPTDEMQKQAGDAARYYTFQKELGPTGKLITQLSNTMPGGKILIPFVRTPINLVKFASERSAFAPLMPSVRQSLMAGGRARDEALARITLGSGLSTAAVLGAMEGRVSGSGPSDPRERAALLQSGWQPYSIRIGNRWVSYSRLDPYSTVLGVAADFAEAGQFATKKEADTVALKLAESVANNITNKTWLSGLSDVFDVLSDPERYGGRYVQNLAASMAVPALSAQTAQATDPNLRDARNIVDAIKARVPVLSQSVPVRRDVWGQPVARGDAIGPDILSPFYASSISPDPVRQEVARLGVPVGMPQRYLTIDGQHVPLNAQQYDELTQLSGHPAKKYLEGAIRTPEYQSLDAAGRVEFIKDAMADFREAGRDALISRHPELDPTDAGSFGAPPRSGSLPPLPQGFQLEH
jgi:endonuclease YncB( thermonuclease family)